MEKALPHVKFKNVESVDVEFISNVVPISRSFYIHLPKSIARDLLRFKRSKKLFVKVRIIAIYEAEDESSAEDNA